MNKKFSHKLSIAFLPPEILLGVSTINHDYLCDDDQYRPVMGIELGFIFFKISFMYIKW